MPLPYKLLLLGLPFMGCLSASSHSLDAASGVTVKTASGPVVGNAASNGDSFLGIPYAEPPVGGNRWQPPKPVAAWTTPRSAQAPGAVCPQPADPVAVVGPVNTLPVRGGEDCLFLNIQRPPAARSGPPLPVMIWLHGGAFVTGAGSETDGSVLAQRQGVIVASVNYRLGALGFMAHPAFSKEATAGTSGNYGLQDQLLAIRWLKDNIAAFGGDPSRITLVGESAGAMSICDLVAAPAAAGLFQGAIIQSGACMGEVMLSPRALAEKEGAELAEQLGCHEAANLTSCMRSKAAEDIVRQSSSTAGEHVWSPLYGDALLPKRPQEAFAANQFNHVPVLNGSTHDEARVFVLMYALAKVPFTSAVYQQWALTSYGEQTGKQVLDTYKESAYGSPLLAYAAASTDSDFSCRAKRLDDALSGKVPVYAFEFNDQHAVSALPPVTEVPQLGAFHSSELVYIFQTPGLVADPAQLSAEQKILADRMMDYWGQFAKTGKPAAEHLPTWPTYQGSDQTILSLAPGELKPASTFSSDHRCDFWSTAAQAEEP